MNRLILDIFFILGFFVIAYFLFKLIMKRREDKKIINAAAETLKKQEYDFYFQGGLKYDFNKDMQDPKYFDNFKIQINDKLWEIEKKRHEELERLKREAEKKQDKKQEKIKEKPKKKAKKKK